MDFERKRRLVQEINLTALIDIVFHLMVFVMLTTSFIVSESMELSLPSMETPASAGKAASAVLRIEIIGDGSVVADNQPMSLEAMNDLLSSRVANDADVKIALYTHSGVSVQQLITVMDAVYLNGGRNIQVDKAA